MTIEWVGLDADDTLWHSEDGFVEITERYVALVGPFVGGMPADEIEAHLMRRERANMPHFGYGVKAFTLSMVEAAAEVTEGAIPAPVLAEVVGLGKELLARPVELLDGVAEVLAELAERYRLLLITKGDLLHQESKILASGLAAHLHAYEVVTEKDPGTYRRVLDRHGIAPAEFVMVGNSVKSDILPVLELGGRAVHIPYQYLWAAEHAEHDGSVPELPSIRHLPTWLAGTR